MKKHIHIVGSATIAISAMLALGPTPLAAQMAPAEPNPGAAATAPPPATAEPIVGPVEGNAPVSTPVIVADPLPVAPLSIAEQPVTNEITASDAASIPAAAASGEASIQRAEVRLAAAAPAQPSAPDAEPVVPADAPTVETEDVAGAEEPAQRGLNAMPVAVPVEPETLAQPADRSEEAILAGLLAALGLGAIGWAAVRLRRRNRRVAQIRHTPVAKPASVEPVPAIGSTAAAASIAPPTPSDIRDWMSPSHRVHADESVSNKGAAVALPMEVPGTFAERDALLRRMVEASPDRANPFRGSRARAKRARLILQSLGHTFEKGRSWIDFSQYPNNWPELRPTYAAAA